MTVGGESIVAPVEIEKDLESTTSGESSSKEVSTQSSGRVSRLRLDAFLVLAIVYPKTLGGFGLFDVLGFGQCNLAKQ